MDVVESWHHILREINEFSGLRMSKWSDHVVCGLIQMAGSCQPTPGQLWFVLPTLVSGRGQAHCRRCCWTDRALTRLVEQPEELDWGGLIAEADKFRVKLAKARIQDAKAEEKVERDRGRTWLTVRGLGEAQPTVQKPKEQLVRGCQPLRREADAGCSLSEKEEQGGAAAQQLLWKRWLLWGNSSTTIFLILKTTYSFFFFFLSQSNVLLQFCFF